MDYFTDMIFSFYQVLGITFCAYYTGSVITNLRIKIQTAKEVAEMNAELEIVLKKFKKEYDEK